MYFNLFVFETISPDLDTVTLMVQLSDVEEEINGLVTYDRKIVKVPVAAMKRINGEIMAEAAKVEL